LITDIKQEILLVTDEGREEETVIRLARVGYDFAIGYLNGGFEAWKSENREVDTINSIPATEFIDIYKKDSNVSILDVRKTGEFLSEHIVDAINLPLDYINDGIASIEKNKTYYVHCAGGYRSMIYLSILKSRGYENLINIESGYKTIVSDEDVKRTEYVCPSTL
jgi:hydroxyacylglutathione hydrolase